MQLHPGSYTLPWHTTDSSDLSMQWAQPPRPYSSTDRSSSLGSMESLDTPTPTAQPYSDSQNSPVDPSLFNNKRDSAYSSFSASSNTSDYAVVQLRPGEACSMDNLLQSLTPACQAYPGDSSVLGRSSSDAPDEAQLMAHKSRSLTRPRPRPIEIKERPSSCCYEQERRAGDFDIVRNGETRTGGKTNPPQPPTRKDSFKATRSRPNGAGKRCTSAPIENSGVCYYEENKPRLSVEAGLQNGFPAPEEDTDFIQRQTNEFRRNRCDSGADKSESTSDCPSGPAAASDLPIASIPVSLSAESSVEAQGQPHVSPSQTKQTSTVLHRHSAPEKLLATQLQLLQFNSNDSSVEPYNPSKPSDSSLSPCPTPSVKWGGSRCSTPGSVFLEVDGEDGNPGTDQLSPTNHIPWGRSASVPGEPSGSSAQEGLSCERIVEVDFQPLSAAASVDTLLDAQTATERGRMAGKNEEGAHGEQSKKKSDSSRNHRRNRRRSERFATNLRNEIQRKKAQLQSSRGPGGLLCSGETVQEEEGSDFCEDSADPDPSVHKKAGKVAFASPAIPPNSQTSEQVKKSNASSESNGDVTQIHSTTFVQNSNRSRSIQILDPGLPSFGVGIRVVEEPAPAGKARRWRWTPEHKLQPEPESERRSAASGERVLGPTGSRHGVCAFSSSSTSSYNRSTSSRLEETDILPFADRMKFFEETSKGISASNMPTYRQKKAARHPEPQSGELGPHQAQRRYSYQGGLQQEAIQLPSSMETRRQSVSTIRERQKEKEREREEREKERQQRESESGRLREIQREREREERVRQWEREREREKEMERAREKEQLTKERQKELERERGREREEASQLISHQECYSIRDRNHDGCQQKPHASLYAQTQNPGLRSAFYPVNPHFQPLDSQHTLHQGYKARSYTPTETYHARQQEATKLNRNYSLTERDYSSWRRESRPPQSANQTTNQSPPHQARWDPRRGDDSSNGHAFALPLAPLFLRGRAMSENDLRFDSSHRWSPSISAATSQTLSEVEEGASAVTGGDVASAGRKNKKKTPPPPRPPPPKWEQFHRRRASHHALLPPSSTATPPLSLHTAQQHLSSSSTPPPDTSRQRSYSLPPERQEAADGCPRCSCSQTPPTQHAFAVAPPTQAQHAFAVAPPSPVFCRKSFRPVAPPLSDLSTSPSPPPGEAAGGRSCVMDLSHAPSCPSPQPSMRPAAEWERRPSPALPVVENGGADVAPCSETFPSRADYEPQQLHTDRGFRVEDQQKVPEAGTGVGTESEPTLSPSPVQSLEADLDVPMETDIDDFQEEELPCEELPLSSELPCFALPVTVLETDIDTLPDPARTAESSEPEEEPERGDGGRVRLSLEELFPHGGEGESGTESWRGTFQTVEHSTDSLDRRSGASSSCSSYYSTSAAKAQLLSQMKDFADSRDRDEDDELVYKKQLMESLRKKLGVLREAQRGLQEDIRANAQLGEEVESMVVSVCKPNEVDKFRMFIGDLDKVVSLLLSLSGRLLRVETTLDTLDPDTEHHDRLPLLEKKRQLMRQLSEAQDLKDHVDRREQAVSRVLARCLSPEQHRDYSHFVKMKAALLVEQRQLEDKIRLGEEQLRGLRESLGLGLGMGMGMSMGYGHY